MTALPIFSLPRSVLAVALLLSASTDTLLFAQTRSDLPVALDAPFMPRPVAGAGKIHLAYELHVSSFRAIDLKLTRIDVFAGLSDAPLHTLHGGVLAEHLYMPGAPSDADDVQLLKGGIRLVVYVWLAFDQRSDVPDTLYHRFHFDLVSSTGDSITRVADRFPVNVFQGEPRSLGPPVHGGRWMLANGPAADSEHRRFVMAIDGRASNSQRFAVDLMKLDNTGALFQGDPSANENWVAYSEEVIAVADGVVTSVNEGVPENTPLAPSRAVRMNRENIDGNYVIVDLGNDAFAFYGHLKPGSIRVQRGQRVHKGQVLASLGNSGNSDAPHLHFHLADANDPHAAEGLPFILDSFAVLRTMTRSQMDQLFDQLFEGKHATIEDAVVHEMEMPMGNAVVRFD